VADCFLSLIRLICCGLLVMADDGLMMIGLG
jgi:hypothetical protein